MFERHYYLLKEVFPKLEKIKVCVIGLGGLGSFVTQYLVRLGVKNLILIDHDKVSETDLNRQILYDRGDLGKSKAEVAELKLKKINPDIKVTSFSEKLNKNNINLLLKTSELIFDCTDNYEARYLINEFSVKNRKPWIFGSVSGYVGHAAIFYPGVTPCFLEVFPNKTTQTSIQVLNITVSTVASVQVKLFLDFLFGKVEPYLYYINLKKLEICKIKIKKRKCNLCREVFC